VLGDGRKDVEVIMESLKRKEVENLQRLITEARDDLRKLESVAKALPVEDYEAFLRADAGMSNALQIVALALDLG
jgi:hypothetical protein